MNIFLLLFIIIIFLTLSKKTQSKIQDDGIKLERTTEIKNIETKRLNHLLNLELNFFNKKILEIGSINGSYAKVIKKVNGKVTLSSPHQKKIDRFKRKNSEYNVINIEDENDFKDIGYFDYVLCYDVLEHIQNPIKAIENLSSITDTIIVESSFTNFYNESIVNVTMDKTSLSSLNGIGSRFSRITLYRLLNNHFNYIYSLKKLPEHEIYKKNWTKINHKENLSQKSRDFLVASKKHILNPNLKFGLIKIHD